VDKRTLIAMGLCLGIFILWITVVDPVFFRRPPPPGVKPGATPPPPKETTVEAPPPTPAAVPGPSSPDQSVLPEPPVVFEVGHLKIEFTNEGAGIRSLWLKDPRLKGGDVALLQPREPGVPHLALRQVGGAEALERVPWRIHERKPDAIEFRRLLSNGVEVSKRFVLNDQTHTLEMLIEFNNRNAPEPGKKEPAEQPMRVEFLAFNGLEHDGAYRHDQYLVGVAYANRVVRSDWILKSVEKGEQKLAEARRIPEEKERNAEIHEVEQKYFSVSGPGREWFGLKNRFFSALLVPKDSAQRLLESYWYRLSSPQAAKAAGDKKNLNATARTEEFRVGGAPVPMQFSAFFGPIQDDVLKDVKDGSLLHDYGSGCAPASPLVNLVAPIILEVLKFFSGLFGNFGVGIVFTTLLIRLCLFPLSKKSQVSMFKMSQLGPRIQVIRDRYKDDPQKANAEQMKLFREHKVNPMSGCLPVFLQLPIFLGMYTVFERSVELRREPFVLWIRDLSQPDAIVRFATVDLPFLPTFDSFNVLPLLMTVTWFLQSYFAPRSTDPQMQAQQKMFMAMPVIFGIGCYSLASGLSLYFFVNSLLGMAEQKLIKKFFLRPEGGPSRP
jgi:YidC/Oxa1 family membrane protein insertase